LFLLAFPVTQLKTAMPSIAASYVVRTPFSRGKAAHSGTPALQRIRASRGTLAVADSLEGAK